MIFELVEGEEYRSFTVKAKASFFSAGVTWIANTEPAKRTNIAKANSFFMFSTSSYIIEVKRAKLALKFDQFPELLLGFFFQALLFCVNILLRLFFELLFFGFDLSVKLFFGSFDRLF